MLTIMSMNGYGACYEKGIPQIQQVVRTGSIGIKRHRKIKTDAILTCLSTVNTSEIEDWGKKLSDNAAASTIFERLLEEAHLVKMPGRSVGLKEVVKEQKVIKSKTESLK